jgi:toxin ParE1/3/4
MRQVAAEPDGPLSKKRPELRAGMSAGVARVRHPVHVLYHRIDREGVIEIVRVLHERMEPKRHLEEL